ncbi:hypothetical protein FK535_00355 [Mycolicibacterium sp. 018/SC-01/001]|uniref:hypothetical protein n=1 Tax=Mycolicibacterium sp. 018/SC-01/001 TaxID=2592069 RepID=UPI00117E7A4D|nr:hypothetical protein [Mycolicibacterium sp. 018/SC-01/001]TRW88776.1 hypothetical protein FK535_00355 [Mycolicibacterium sp. 018/SC-01/001]
MNRVILGGEAVRAGVATRHELRRDYTKLHRGVFVRGGGEISVKDRAIGAWLATGRRGVIAGVSASALHGAPWVDARCPIEVTGVKGRPQDGLLLRTERLAADEITRVGGLPVTSRVRTAFDLGRHLERTEALARLDALMWNQRFDIEAVAALTQRYPRVRGIAQLRELLPLVDGGAASPRESALRLALHDNGFPRPETQYPVLDGTRPVAFLDLAYVEYGVAVEYDGDHHRKDRTTYVKDIARLRMLEQRGWIVVRVIAEDQPAAWLSRVAAALRARGCPLQSGPVTTLSA